MSSMTAFLTPSITKQPALNLTTGALSASAQGLGNLSYQWYKNGIPVSGATLASLSLDGLASGNYTLKTTNGFATVTSSTVAFDASRYDPNFSLIPAGIFTMGNNSMVDAPEHSVNVSAFLIGKTDVTYAEWSSVKAWAQNHGYNFDNAGTGNGDNYPVTNISWYDSVKWSNAKSEMQGLMPVYYTDATFSAGSVYRTGQVNLTNSMVNWNANGYRLPTEAEWEKAARGGLIGKPYPNGDTLTSNDANINWSMGGTATPVKNYAPNGFGLYDTAGNVWQWCWDLYGTYSGLNDPQGSGDGDNRIVRGGACRDAAQFCRVSFRESYSPSFNNDAIGLRLARRGLPTGFPSAGQPYIVGNSLTVNTQGTPPLSFQWFYNGGSIATGTLSSLPLAGLASGTYSVTLSNGLGRVTSSSLQLQVAVPEMILVQGGTLPTGSTLAGQVVGDFQIGKTEVTWGEWKSVRDWAVNNGYGDLVNVGAGDGDNYPAQTLNWYDAVKWCNAKSEKEGKTPVYQTNGIPYRTGQITPSLDSSAKGYRLLTEAEWEWAARGGRQTHGYTYSGSNDLNAVGWYGDYVGGPSHAVATKNANELGIYDMSGNAWEWCDAWYPGFEGSKKMIRGGVWNYGADYCTVNFRGNAPLNTRYYYIGFRFARSSN
jgi:formylglycine-generating enzyme required for sulfatase activity